MRVPKTFQGFFKGTLENPQNFKGVSRVLLKTLEFQGKVEGEIFKGGKECFKALSTFQGISRNP